MEFSLTKMDKFVVIDTKEIRFLKTSVKAKNLPPNRSEARSSFVDFPFVLYMLYCLFEQSMASTCPTMRSKLIERFVCPFLSRWLMGWLAPLAIRR
jgi:hypothetical protein